LPITCRNREPSSKSLARIPATPTWVVATAAAVVWLVSAGFMVHFGAHWYLDLRVYQSAGHALFHNGQPFEDLFTENHLPFTYPPFALFVLSPLSLDRRDRSAVVAGQLGGARVHPLPPDDLHRWDSPESRGCPGNPVSPGDGGSGSGWGGSSRHAVIPNGRGERSSTQDSWSFSPSAIAYRSLIVTITLRNPGARVGLDSEHRIDLDL